MPDRTDEVLDLVLDALGAASYTVGTTTHAKPAGLAVLDQALEPVETSDLPTAGVYPLTEKVTHTSAAPPVTDRDLDVAVELRAEISAGDSARRALSPLRTWAIIALLNHAPLKAFVRELPREIGTTWENGETRTGVACCTVSFRLRYRTRYGDPTTT